MFGSLTRRAARGPAPRRARGDDGAAMVEAAIVMPLLMLLVFGIIEWGLAFLSATSTNSAARSGARTASASTQNTSYAQQAVLAVEQNLKGALPFATPEELWIYRVPTSSTDDSGFPEGQTSFVCGANCIKYTWNGTSFSLTSGSWPAAEPSRLWRCHRLRLGGRLPQGAPQLRHQLLRFEQADRRTHGDASRAPAAHQLRVVAPCGPHLDPRRMWPSP